MYRYVVNDPTNRTDPSGLASVDGLDWLLGHPSSRNSAANKVASFTTAMSDTITGGAVTRLQARMGTADMVDRTSTAYRWGGYAGQAWNVVASVAAAGAAAVFSLAGAATAAADGDMAGMTMALGQAALARIAGGNPCAASTRAASWTLRGIGAFGTGTGVVNAYERLKDGDFLGAALDLVHTSVGAYRTFKPCFAAGTPLLWEFGSKAIELLKKGDRVWARDELSPYGLLELKTVEEVFVSFGRILHLHIGTRVIRTTPEHPFYVRNKGWIAAGQLQPGDLLSSHDGQWLPFSEVHDTGEYETVYNLRVADFHTYFVGDEDWGFSVWSHNTCKVEISRRKYPEAAAHIEAAQAAGKPAVVTVDRTGAAARRRQSLAGKRTASGKDRDEYPPALAIEGGAGASVQLIGSSDNRGAGSTMGQQLRGVPNGTRVEIRVVG